jgi:hypothetical protein
VLAYTDVLIAQFGRSVDRLVMLAGLGLMRSIASTVGCVCCLYDAWYASRAVAYDAW